MGSLDTRMAGNEFPGMVDFDHFAVGQDFHALAGQAIRHRVAVGLKGHQAVFGNVAQRSLLDHVGPMTGHRQEKVLFLEEHLRRLPMGRPVDALVGHLDDPLEKLRVEIVEARKLLPPEEALDVLDARFHLALGLGPVRPMGRRPEAIVSAEVPKDRIPFEARAFEVPAQDDRPQVVIDDLVGDAAEVFEGLLMGPEERRHLLVGCRHGVHPPAVAQR